jgi:hypothetical protein
MNRRLRNDGLRALEELPAARFRHALELTLKRDAGVPRGGLDADVPRQRVRAEQTRAIDVRAVDDAVGYERVDLRPVAQRDGAYLPTGALPARRIATHRETPSQAPVPVEVHELSPQVASRPCELEMKRDVVIAEQVREARVRQCVDLRAKRGEGDAAAIGPRSASRGTGRYSSRRNSSPPGRPRDGSSR